MDTVAEWIRRSPDHRDRDDDTRPRPASATPGPPRHARRLSRLLRERATSSSRVLPAFPDADRWTLISIQGLHRFYRARTEDIVASWMTRQDRELAIADNIAYVDSAIAAASNGIARLDARLCRLLSRGGDGVPRRCARTRQRHRASSPSAATSRPSCWPMPMRGFLAVLLVRGAQDAYYPQHQFDGNADALRVRGADVTTVDRRGHARLDRGSLRGGGRLPATADDVAADAPTSCRASARGARPLPRSNATRSAARTCAPSRRAAHSTCAACAAPPR